MNDNVNIKQGVYGYPIQCPACIEKGLSFQCSACLGSGEILLKLGEEEIKAFYQEYLVQRQEGISGCPFMSGDIRSQQKNCPISGAIKLD